MHTEQSRMVRESLEATSHPDVYARRKTPTRRADEVVVKIACICPTSPRDADGNCDLIEQDDCPVHGKVPGYMPDPTGYTYCVEGDVWISIDGRMWQFTAGQWEPREATGLVVPAGAKARVWPGAPGGRAAVANPAMSDPLPDSADTRLHGIDGLSPSHNHMPAEPCGERCPRHGAFADEAYMANLGRRREGWRGRLAHVEMLLREGMDATGTSSLTYKKVEQALAEIRQMIDEA